jgi:hypothetical protein
VRRRLPRARAALARGRSGIRVGLGRVFELCKARLDLPPEQPKKLATAKDLRSMVGGFRMLATHQLICDRPDARTHQWPDDIDPEVRPLPCRQRRAE